MSLFGGTLCFVVALIVAVTCNEVADPRQDMYSAICRTENHGIQLADPFDCSQFIHCHHGRAEIKKCSPGTRYDDKIQVCNWEHLVQCSGETNVRELTKK